MTRVDPDKYTDRDDHASASFSKYKRGTRLQEKDQMTRVDPDKYTYGDDHAHLKTKASSPKYKRGTRLQEKDQMTRVDPDKYRQRRPCLLRKELAEGQLFKIQEGHPITRDGSDDKSGPRQVHRQRRPCLLKKGGRRPALQSTREAPDYKRRIR
jgi:hypothetical protein